MSDPRNVAHDKKVISEKQHKGEDITDGAAHVPQPGKKMAHAPEKHDPAHEHAAAVQKHEEELKEQHPEA